MQTDGNFVLSDADSVPLQWVNDGGHESEGWFLRLTDDGRVELCNAAGQPLWDRNGPWHR